MEENEITEVDPDTGEVIQPKEKIGETIDKLINDDGEKNSSLDFSSISLFEEEDENKVKPEPYTTELINHIQQINPSLTVDQINELVNYIKGGQRPEFMDNMLTQTNEKLVELTKLLGISQLIRIPTLIDYYNTLNKNLINPERIKDMSFDEISTIATNVQKDIRDTLSFAFNLATKLPQTNTNPTKVEKLAAALMGVSEATRERIEEIIKSEE